MTDQALELYDYAWPPLTEGDYTLSTEIDVAAKDGPVAYSRSQAVRVAGPAAGLTPGDVVAFSPPDGSTGAYATWVPNVTLARQTLPWEVEIDGQGRNVPWLAVVVLRRSRIVDVGSPPHTTTGTGAQSLADYLSPGAGYFKPTPSAAVAATWAATTPQPVVNTVDAHVRDVLAALPPVGSLPLLCHVRDASKAPDIGAAAQPIPLSSVVLANVAVPGDVDDLLVAHLVNVDGFVPGLWSPGNAQLVRFISLASWSFRSAGTSADFAALAAALTAGQFGWPDDATPAGLPSTLTHLGLADPEAKATYTGPLVPPPPHTPTRGPTDIGLAAAAQLGRLLLLSNRVVLGAVLAWAEAGVHAVQLAHERTALGGALPVADHARHGGTGARAALAHTLAGGALRRVLTEGLHDRRPPGNRSQVLGGSPPAARMHPRHQAIGALLARPEVRMAAAEEAGDLPQQLLAWVDSVRHLGLAPFAYLAPDPALLPNEGIRFFYVDGTWAEQLVAGALSLINSVPTRDGADAGPSSLSHMLDALQASIPPDTVTQRSGFLLRSQLVADWPDLGVLSWADTGRTTALTTTVTRPAPNLMLAVIDGVAQRVDLQLAVQGLHLTVTGGAASVSGWAASQSITAASALANALIDAAAKPTRQSFAVGVS